MRVKNQIAIILLISFSILIGHNLVPHHHHAEVLTTPQSDSCPIDHHDHHDHDDDDDDDNGDTGTKHCHAFNNIDFVKYNHTEVSIPEKASVNLIIDHSTTLPDPHADLVSAQQICLKLPIRPAPFLNLHFMRAPPSMA
ncbi:MAG: hypothetical protein ABFS10_04405 [Bacteroidota bacterium]